MRYQFSPTGNALPAPGPVTGPGKKPFCPIVWRLPVHVDVARQHGGYDGFDFVIISSEVGSKKPDAAIFEIALQHLPGIRPDQIIFLDDREPAITTASKLGLQTILVKDHARAIAEIEKLIDKE